MPVQFDCTINMQSCADGRTVLVQYTGFVTCHSHSGPDNRTLLYSCETKIIQENVFLLEQAWYFKTCLIYTQLIWATNFFLIQVFVIWNTRFISNIHNLYTSHNCIVQLWILMHCLEIVLKHRTQWLNIYFFILPLPFNIL